jgi:radical SAM-linked protein
MRQIKFSWRDPEVSLIECILGRGDRRMSAAIRQAWEAGSVFDGWTDYFSYSTWKTAFSNSGLKVENYITVLSIDDPLPWDHIDKGVSKTFLKSERQNAYSEIVVQDCKAGQCLACGIQRKGGFAELAVCYKSPDGKKAESKTEAAVPFSIPNNESKDVPVISQFYRVRFAKKEYGKYLSHLDIVRAFERACRHSEIPLIYSQGFNPHPRMSFAPPLSLGYTSEAEYVDLEISAAYQKNLLIDLNRYLPEGIFLTDMKVINRRPDTLSELINSSLYRVNLDERVIREQSFDKALEQLLDAEQIIVSRNTKGIEKNIDIRPYIVSIDKMDRSIRIKTRYLDKRTVRLKEIINELIGENFKNGFYISVHRVEQLINKNGLELTPLEILP